MSNSIIIRKNTGNTLTVIKSGTVSTTLAPATNTTLGGIIVGDNLTITSNGLLSAQPGGVTGFNNRTGNVSLTSSDVTTALAYTPLAPLGNVTRANSTLISNTTSYIRGEVYQSGSLQIYSGYSAGGSTVEPTSFRAGIACGTRDLYFTTTGSTASFGSLLLTNNASATVQAGLSALYNACMSVTGGDSYPGTKAWHQILNTKTAVGSITGNIAVSKTVMFSYSNSTELTIAANETNSQALLTVSGALPLIYTANSILTQSYADTRYQPVGSYLTDANLTPYLTISTAASTYSVLGHTHTVSNVTGLQAELDSKLPTANFTYANITGKPTLATVATSGSYTDLSNLPASYSLPVANTTTLGGVIVGSGISVSNGTISVSTAYAGLSTNSFTGSQNLQDNELIRAKIRDYSETVSSPTISSGTLTLNLETSNVFTVSLNAAITTLTISNPPASGSAGSFTLIFTADGTARAVTWPASIKWAGGTAPTLTSTSGKADSFAFFTSDGGTTWQGYIGGQNF